MNARAWMLIAAAALSGITLHGCSSQQGQAFLNNVGGVDG
jgi:outer membrane murein-binding lipoprotein Lpp